MSITPIAGWALNRIVEMDEHHPGIAGHVLRASAERRQVVAAFLSVSRPHVEFSCDDDRGSFLIHATHDAILRAAYGAVPSGLRRALGRAGPTPHPRRFYLYLYALLSSPGQQAFDKIVGRMTAIDLDRLRIARLLPTDLLRDNIISHINSASDARDLRAYVSLLAEHDVDRDALIDAIASAPSRDAITHVARRWTLKARLPDHPVPASSTYRPISTGEELRRTALRYRNCMRMYVVNVLERRSSFALFRHGDQEAVVHLIASEGGWELERLYGHRNGTFGSGFRQEAEAYLRQHHIRLNARSGTKRPLDPLRRMMAHFDPYGDDD